eukprot:CAMPEP_0176496492 /NCGR_PEP_ID=MMETSP0200_2-20121128/11222_1 /TAXON_ID=947934 /ORGANISM="Chaetoceros sp., Strain GSL56" /LENGTH=1362 /DNA_ID=CAMNT_0017894447 /DNA_START=499 /DNA_END=4587 /DNA_ORIENTATION=+
MASPSSPLPTTLADRDAEIVALQTAFDEYIASSRELEDELDAELAKMQEKLAESSAANAALISQLESLNPQLSSLEKALSDTKAKLETESSLRRDTELELEEAQARARESEGTIEKLKAENEEIHEQLAFREEELEELRLELEVEKERHSVELEELAAQLAQQSSSNGGRKSNNDFKNSSSQNQQQQGKGGVDGDKTTRDDISVMTEDGDFVTLAVASNDANADDQEDYIKRLEDELEDVTEQLIEAETNISNMEGKLVDAEKKKLELEKKVQEMEGNLEEMKKDVDEAAKSAVATREEAEAAKAVKEELALLTEELHLTQEELKAAEEDAKAASANLEKAEAEHKATVASLKKELESVRGSASGVDQEILTLQKALEEANSESARLRDEVQNLTIALENAKSDYEKTLLELDALRNAFDENEENVRRSLASREEELIKEHRREIQDLQAELLALQESNQAMKAANAQKSGPSAAEVDLKTKLESKQKELERLKNELNEERKENVKAKRKIEELSAGNRALINGTFDAANQRSEPMSSLSKSIMLVSHLKSDEDEEGDVEVSEFYRSHARSRPRYKHEPVTRGRSSSPTTVVRLEREVAAQSQKAKTLSAECEELKSQKRMTDVRVKHLESDVAKLRKEVERAEARSENLVNAVASGITNPEARDDSEELDKDIEKIIATGSKEEIQKEVRALARKASLQKEHNAQLLVKILKLQGNIQVFCRIRPMTGSEIKNGTQRVVEPLNESEVGVFDERTKNWKSFTFDKVWGPDSHQLGVFQDVEPLALSVVDGYNACIFAYGQTGSGKTYTMEGGEGTNRGISFRTIEKIFNLLNFRVAKQDAIIKKMKEAVKNGNGTSANVQGRFEFSINVGMLEIYNDNVYDLLVKPDKRKKKTALEIKRTKEGRMEVAGLIKESVNSVKDVAKLLKKGNESRSTAATDLNEHSSRSHMVLLVDVVSGIHGEEPCTGTLYLVDLAGSERVRKSGVEGENLKEATQINKSLSALGNVMEALDRKASHIPYRDSKLTYLLQDSLGGNSRTMMVVAVCPTSPSFDESVHALNFATRVRRINIGSAQRNVSSKNLEETVKQLNSELKNLAKSKKKSEEQLLSLKKDHSRIQERLKASSESRAKSTDEARTLSVLKDSNAQMTARWQKEKQMHDEAVANLETSQAELKKVQADLGRATREIERLSKLITEKENEQDALKSDLRKAKTASSAANLRARKAQVLQSRTGGVGVSTANDKSTGIVKPTPRSEIDTSEIKNVDPSEAREKVLTMLKAHDPKKVDKIDAIMERFKGREGFLLVKMASRYEGRNEDTASNSGSRPNSAPKKRSEIAMARHMERMRSKSKLIPSSGSSTRSLRDN